MVQKKSTKRRDSWRKQDDDSQVERGEGTIMTEGRVEGDGVVAVAPSVVVELQFN